MTTLQKWWASIWKAGSPLAQWKPATWTSKSRSGAVVCSASAPRSSTFSQALVGEPAGVVGLGRSWIAGSRAMSATYPGGCARRQESAASRASTAQATAEVSPCQVSTARPPGSGVTAR